MACAILWGLLEHAVCNSEYLATNEILDGQILRVANLDGCVADVKTSSRVYSLATRAKR